MTRAAKREGNALPKHESSQVGAYAMEGTSKCWRCAPRRGNLGHPTSTSALNETTQPYEEYPPYPKPVPHASVWTMGTTAWCSETLWQSAWPMMEDPAEA